MSIGVTLPGFVVRFATSSNAAARSYSPASTASLIASLIASSLVEGDRSPLATIEAVHSAPFSVTIRDESSGDTEKQAGSRSAPASQSATQARATVDVGSAASD